jgi:hypothetical protein
MKLQLKKDSTNVTVNIFIQNALASDGSGLTGLAYDTGNPSAYYVKPRSTPQLIEIVNQTDVGDHIDGGFVEIDGTNMPGLYRIDLPDASLATAAGKDDSVIIMFQADNAIDVLLEIQLTGIDMNTPIVDPVALTDILQNSTDPSGVPSPISVDSNGHIDVSDKTGFSLASDGLDSISTDEPSGRATNFREMIVQNWMRFFNKVTKTSSIITVHDKNNSEVTEQNYDTSGTTETVFKSSDA